MSNYPEPRTAQQRASLATDRLRAVVGLHDLKLLSAAVAEAAADEASRNPAFLAHVRSIYEELTRLRLLRAARGGSRGTNNVKLIPLPGTEGIRIDPFASLDPYLLLRLYGPAQLRTALSGYSYAALRDAAAKVKDRHPNTKPKDGRKVDSLLEYIVEKVAVVR